MECKSYEAYRAVLLHLQEVAPRFRPRIVMADFERAQQAAWVDVYHCIVRGCYIHFVRVSETHFVPVSFTVPKTCLTIHFLYQNVGKKSKKHGLTKQLLSHEPELRSIVRSFNAIPLLPHEEMHHGVMVLIRRAMRANVIHHLFGFLAYFIRTWMIGQNYEILSVYNQGHRTNNACEAANRILRLETGPHHPNVWNSIRKFSKIMWFISG